MSPEEKYNYYIKESIFEDDLLKDQRHLNEDSYNTDRMDPLRGLGGIENILFTAVGGVIGLIFGGIGVIGGAVALKKLKNLMSRAIYWTEFGNDRGGKGKSKNTSNYKNNGGLWST